jgi:predicted RNase H-like HicB family nuclease
VKEAMLMNNEVWERAEELAARPYSITIEQDTLSNGQVVFLARHPELPGCKAQGNTIDEAKKSLDEARVDYIYALLESGLEVPAPVTIIPTSMNQATRNARIWILDASRDRAGGKATIDLSDAPQQSEQTLSISLQGDLA